MKKTARFLATLCLLQSSLHAQSVASTMNYQGKVTDSTGTGIGTGTPVNRKIRFRVYDAASGGNLLWGEQQTVTIANGEFSVLLGTGDVYTLGSASDSHSTLDTVINTNSSGSSPSNDRYMEITVDDGGGTIDASDTPISPRQQITSTAFAYRAKTAESVGANNSLQLGAATSSGLGFYNASRLFNSYTIDGPVLYGNSGGALGSYSGGSTQKATLLWNSAGQVGIGTPVLSGSNTTTTNKLVLQGDDANTPAQQMVIRGNIDPTERLTVGFDTTGNQATLQSYTGTSAFGNLLLNPSGGNVGIGTTTPGVPLTFASTLGDKISLWGQGAVGCGIGVQSGQVQIHGGNSGDDVTLGYGSSAAMTETMRVKGNGNVGIGTSSPSQKLTVAGGINVYGVNAFIGAYNSAQTSSLLMAVADSAGNFSTSAAAGDAVLRSTGTSKLLLQSGVNAAALTIDTSNKVGIGTTTPSNFLSVEGGGQVATTSTSTAVAHFGGGDVHTYFGSFDGSRNYATWLQAMRPSDQLVFPMSINPNGGNVGIGIGAATPNAKLTVGSPLVGSAMSTAFGVNAGQLGTAINNELLLGSIGYACGNQASLGISAFRTAAGTNWGDNALILGMNVDNSPRAGAWMSLHSNGNVGIGTVTPAVPLDVAGYSTLTMYDNGITGNATTQSGTAYTLTNAVGTGRGIEVYSMDGAGNWSPNYSVTGKVGIRSAYAIATGTQFLCYSDRRIKCDLHPSPPANDLALIEKLQPTNYRMVDPDAGTEWKKGFIAQEVEKVIPQAVTRSTEFVPEIMSLATASHYDAADKTLALTLSKDHALKVGDKVRLHLDGRRLDLVVGAVPSARELVMNGCDKEPQKVLVYGKQVNDFRTVDYDRIFTTGIGAIQELDRQLKEKDAKIAALEAKVAAQDKRSTAQADEVSSQNARLVALEKLINKAGAPETVSIKLGGQ